MPSDTVDAATPLQGCNCLALRQATRHVTQFYDQCLAPTGLRTTQLSILARLQRQGPLTINALARELVMDRTTLGRTMLPLERDGLITVGTGTSDRRSKLLQVTPAGLKRIRVARRYWTEAQSRMEEVFGAERTTNLRNELVALAASDLGDATDAKR